MNTIMSPSDEKITAGQIGKISDLLSAGLRKAGLLSEPTQLAIEDQGAALTDDLVAVVRRFVEGVSSLIIRIVEVTTRSLKPQEMLDDLGRKQYTDKKAVESMPRGEGNEAKLTFFQVGEFVSDDNLEKEFAKRKLKPADPYSLAAANKSDPALADTKPNGTHWKDADGNWYYVAFHRWYDGGRRVHVRRRGDGWSGSWWFAGLPIESSKL